MHAWSILLFIISLAQIIFFITGQLQNLQAISLSPTLTVSSNFEVHSPIVYYLCILMVWLLGACAMMWFSILWLLHNMFVCFHTQLRESSPFFVYLKRLLTSRLITLWHGLPIGYLWFEIFSLVISKHVNLSTACQGLGTSWHIQVCLISHLALKCLIYRHYLPSCLHCDHDIRCWTLHWSSSHVRKFFINFWCSILLPMVLYVVVCD